MIDLEAFILPLEGKRALLLSDSEWGLEELEGLLTTLGGVAEEKFLLPRRKIDPSTYIGSGKLLEAAQTMEARGIDVLLVDFDLSPSQLKNIEKQIKRLVLDRSGIILEIFNRHARTKEAKLQVEIARLEYFMPRLRHLWSHFERQRGSGGAALKGKGMGEKQIEVDRRLVKDRINFLKRKLKEVESTRQLQRKSRESILKVAIVGYTNAGKSTLINALTESHVLVEDALFATLDAQVKLLNPKSKPTVVAIDTVGFIDRLPHSLVASFRSTLGEIIHADLLLHVLDASHPEVQRHFEVTMEVLKELGTENIPMMVVFNKMDQIDGQNSLLKLWAARLTREYELPVPPIFISARNPSQVKDLRERIIGFFDHFMETYEIVIPYEDGKLTSQIFEHGTIESKRSTDRGTFFRVRTLPQFAAKMNLAKYKI